MKEKHIEGNESKGIFYEGLEAFARVKIRQHLQNLLEQEVTEWLGRDKSQRKGNPLDEPRYRNGYGKTRRFTYEQWKSVPIEQEESAYLWADGIYVKAGIGRRRRRCCG
ncbi:MAG: hypothetical protein WD688_10005 [Candidatus Binatia bacterium]